MFDGTASRWVLQLIGRRIDALHRLTVGTGLQPSGDNANPDVYGQPARVAMRPKCVVAGRRLGARGVAHWATNVSISSLE